MKTKKIVLGSIVSLAAVSIALAGCARSRFSRMTVEMKADCIAGRIASELDLTAAQTAALNGIKAEVVAKIRQEGPEREALMQKALELLKGENLSASSVKELLEKRDARMRSIEPFLAEKIAAFHRILTPEQRRMAAEKISMRMARCRR